MAERRTLPIPIPGSELQRMQEQLARRYGSELWDHEGHRILVIRVPGDDPDVVNDLERAIEYLFPSDIKDLDRCLLIGDRRTTAVSVGPLARLMEDRLRHDEAIAAHLRQQLESGAVATSVPAPGRPTVQKPRAPDARHGNASTAAHGDRSARHVLYRDSRRLDRMVRLGVRIDRPRAGDIDDEDLDALAEELVPRLQTPPYNEVRALHILADQDHVRIDPDLFLAELRRRHDEDASGARQQAEAEAERLAREAERRRQRDEIAAVLRRRYDDVEVPAPAWEQRRATTDPVTGSTRSGSSGSGGAIDIGRTTPDAIRPRLAREEIDALRPCNGGTMQRAAYTPGTAAGSGSSSQAAASPGPTGSGAVVDPARASSKAEITHMVDLAEQTLRAAGYETLKDPRVPGHDLAIAAERDEPPAKLIVQAAPHMGTEEADRILAACRGLGVDLGIIVAPTADDAARERLVATKAKWVDREALAALRL